jgi:molybdopterin/thiamine biosynthesis adenylyltransferase
MDLDFSEDEIRRYSRHILLQQVGGTGQSKLKAAKVLVIGAGGLGSPLALYLAAAGIGTIGLVDDDRVEISNLQRQIAHTTARIGVPKALSAAEAARAINPEVHVVPHEFRLGPANAIELIQQYDLVCDGTDNFGTRFLIADACALAKRTVGSARWHWQNARWFRQRYCGSTDSCRCSSRIPAGRATAVSTPNPRPTDSCRPVGRLGSSARSPA